MGKHRTLGQAGGSAVILDKRDVLFGIDGVRRAVVFISEQVRKPAEAGILRPWRDVMAAEQPVGLGFGRRESARDRTHDQMLDRRSAYRRKRIRQRSEMGRVGTACVKKCK